MKRFRLAPMSGPIRVMTFVFFLIPLALIAGTLAISMFLAAGLALIAFIYAWIWLRFRPTAFVIHADRLEVVWPLKRRQISRDSIQDLRLMTTGELKQNAGFCMRVGAGGLWGGFGWLWTERRGIVQMYISRTDELVWIERGAARPWLITPERPKEFIGDLLPQG